MLNKLDAQTLSPVCYESRSTVARKEAGNIAAKRTIHGEKREESERQSDGGRDKRVCQTSTCFHHATSSKQEVKSEAQRTRQRVYAQ